MANKAQVLFTCTDAFKDALGTYAQNKNTSVADVIRRAIAKEIGYDLSKEPVDTRRKYASVEARKEAQNRRGREAREEVKKLVAAFNKEQRISDALKLERSLNRKGIDV